MKTTLYRMNELIPMYRIENILARQKFEKTARRHHDYETAEQLALLGRYRRAGR